MVSYIISYLSMLTLFMSKSRTTKKNNMITKTQQFNIDTCCSCQRGVDFRGFCKQVVVVGMELWTNPSKKKDN